ncbi:DUF739 family protein [Anaerotignum lactatifermentans]|uniref:DUF739 family protein n=1 Tax=Anaerotignum lactatifermentans TaxID=160404 RepID=UPI003AB5AA58
MERDYRKLRGKIVEVYGTMSNFAKEMGYSERTISLKINGKVDFSQSDIVKMVSLLGLRDKDIPIYFFTNKVQSI